MSSIYVVVRLVHFIGGNVSSQPISFHKSESEAASAKATELELMTRRLKVQGAKKLLTDIGVAAVSLEVGEFATGHEDLVKVPRIIIPPS